MQPKEAMSVSSDDCLRMHPCCLTLDNFKSKRICSSRPCSSQPKEATPRLWLCCSLKVPTQMQRCGTNCVHFAVEKGNDNIVAQLLAHDPGLAEVKDDNGDTALYYATQEQIVAQLLAHTSVIRNNTREHPCMQQPREDMMASWHGCLLTVRP